MTNPYKKFLVNKEHFLALLKEHKARKLTATQRARGFFRERAIWHVFYSAWLEGPVVNGKRQILAICPGYLWNKP